MCLPFLNLFVRYDALQYMSSNLLRGWCVAYVGDVSKVKILYENFICCHLILEKVVQNVVRLLTMTVYCYTE
jgi:hypothetical protein